MLNVRTVVDMQEVIVSNLHRIDRSRFDCIVGIPRSGMLPATMLATMLQLPLADPTGYARGIIHGPSGFPVNPGKRVLLVDDTCNKGRAMARAVVQLQEFSSPKITRLAVYGPYQVERPERIIDISLAECHGPRVFAWNLWKHIRLPRWGFDFDGVLCRDPTKDENDDGPRYVQFLNEVEPLFLPKRPIGHIVTGRAEKYRNETENWLRRYGVKFEGLHMTPFHTKAERMSAFKFAGGRGGWKAGIVKQLGVEMFIESCPKQAGIIAREAQVPVWCTRTQALA